MFRGSCLCGTARYELHISEEAAKKASLQPIDTFLRPAIPAAFKLTAGALKTVAARHIDEGFEFTTAFCGECGSTIYALPPGDAPPKIVLVQAGTLDDALPIEVAPERELNVKDRPDWVSAVKGAVQCRTYEP
ncbi:hypothetical protein B0J12DRAFT_735053 [Macrophomina phaseolina]|uniref:CENP-V/GFA domain-containing protein n=1 Tax=Macrophomina phaseolina TaxID=35725 RepID=A0ABQ8GRK4_9PEZI|nr:hypothetical protein B0J12DRAFT_735053 [Macrophomina phaseolina]